MRHSDESHSEGNDRFSNFTSGDVALFKDIADAAADSAVQKMFVMMGHDPKDPRTAQLDAAWTRKMRERSDGMFGKAIMTIVAISVLGGARTLWDGLKAALAATPLPPH